MALRKWAGIILNQKPAREQLATPNDLRFIGRWTYGQAAHAFINGSQYEISLKKGGQTTALLFNLLTVKDCKPFINKATVIGRKQGKVLVQARFTCTHW